MPVCSHDAALMASLLARCPSGLLQVLLPLMLALAALHGHPEQPPAPHAQPEEPRLQLESRRPEPSKGWRKRRPCLSLGGRAARWAEHGAGRTLGVRAPPRHRHQALGNLTLENVHFLHLLGFLLFTVALCTVTLGEKWALHTYTLFFFFVYVCMRVSQTNGQTVRWESA